MALTNANAVADYILCYVQDFGDLITNLKLQKLVYYAQAWFLALYGKPLVGDEFEAWVHGPVQPELYQRFKRYGWKPILKKVQCPKFSPKIRRHLDEIMDVYGDLTAHHLERLTHKEDPWRKARKGLAPDQESHNEISIQDMKVFYSKLSEEDEEDNA